MNSNVTLNINGDNLYTIKRNYNIKEHLENLSISEFLILDLKEPLERSLYLQTLRDEDNEFVVEIRFVYDDGFKHYQSYKNLEETIKIFEDYLNDIIPSIESWDNITDDLM